MNWTELQSFLQVAETGSVTAAADALEVPRSTVSRRVTRLEEDLGVSLLIRTGRTVELTQNGQLVKRRCRQAFFDLTQLEQVLLDHSVEPQGELRITATPSLGTVPAFAQLLTAYREACPQVDVYVTLTSRSVSLLEEGIDIALRAGSPVGVGERGLMQRKVTTYETRLYASPDYLDRHGRPEAVDQLREHSFVCHPIVRHAELLAGKYPAWETIAQLTPALALDDMDTVAELLSAGAGIGLLVELKAEPYVRKGALEPVLPELSLGEAVMWLLWPEIRFTAIRVRRFIDLAVEIMGKRIPSDP